MTNFYRLLLGFLFASVALSVADAQVNKAERISYNRDIRPILSNHCFACHGPDENSREAGLRLDVRNEAIDYGAIVAGEPDESSIIERVSADDSDMLMPPADSGKEKLTPEQVSLFRKWIQQGADYETHWSFVSPERPILPKSKPTKMTEHQSKLAELDIPIGDNPIDQLVVRQLFGSQLGFSPPAEKRTLARRAALTITGLPPTVEQLQEFLTDKSDDAYEKYVDRLFASPAYGERMAATWMDIARYSDTDGFQGDQPRTNWPWRDWVVQAYNKNMPFDQFTIEQFAGDLLPNATADQILATCFHRNHMTNGEGGRDPAESRVDYVLDRVNTMGTAWLGLTLGCAQCHTHKYDPITQHEYYQLTAFFNSIDEDGRAGGNAKPYMQYQLKDAESILRAPKLAVEKREVELQTTLKQANMDFKEWLLAQARGFATAPKDPNWQTIDFSEVASSEDSVRFEQETRLSDDKKSKTGTGVWRVVEGRPNTLKYRLSGNTKQKTIAAIRLEILPDESHKNGGLSFASNGNICLTDAKFQLGDKSLHFDSVWVDFQQVGFPASHLLDSEVDTGWAVASTDMKRSRTVIFRLTEPVAVDESKALQIELAWYSHLPTHWATRFRFSTSPHRSAQHPSPLTESLLKSDDVTQLDATTLKTVSDWYLAHDNKLERARLEKRQAEVRLKRAKDKTQLKVMVLKELAKPRSTYVLKRGVWNQHGDEVQRLTPKILNPLSQAEDQSPRLKLAKWLVDTNNPLTARVTVNRYWQMHFGEALVRTPEDFGLQGEMPTHPELLDWLAVEFMESGWDVKHINRLIVTSYTFKQSSKRTKRGLQIDPQNRLLTRGPRFRLPAATIRDAAFASSGLLSRRIGGPPVKPYQPPNIWASSDQGRYPYVLSSGDDLYRRSLYTYWRRNIAPPGMFDSAQRRVCTVRVIRTNSPMHALNLMNDTTFIEAARVLASTAWSEILSANQTASGSDAMLAATIDRMFLRVLSRPANDEERTVLLQSFEKLLASYEADEKLVDALLQQGTTKLDPAIEKSLSRPRLAALTILASTILNLDECLNLE